MTDQATDRDPDMEPDIPGKPTSASRTTLSHIMTHNDTNLLGTVHGGVIMKLVDDAAGAVAGRHPAAPPSPRPWTRWRSSNRSASVTWSTSRRR